jgi:hypothetical protein
MATQQRITAGNAVLRGHLLVTLPTLVLLVTAATIGRRQFDSIGLGLVVALVPALLWWVLVIPRWRRWALSQGVDPVQLQELGAKAGLLWPTGSTRAGSGLPPDNRR